MHSTILITGVSGFIGGALARRLASSAQFQVRAAVRREPDRLPERIRAMHVGDLTADTRWDAALAGVDTVVHAAGRAHVVREQWRDPLGEFCRVNVDGSVRLARAAVAAGVRRFVFLSSVKVHGETTAPGRPFRADDAPAPQDPYSVSKQLAEEGLRAVAANSAMALVIVRPPLEYGPGVQANFRSLIRWVRRGVPLPFASIDNRRSLVALDNLVDLLCVCLTHPAAANRAFLVSDGEDLSLPDLVQRLAGAMGRRARLVPLPCALIDSAARLLARPELAQRLCGSLQVDISDTRGVLDWSPPVSVDAGLRAAVQAFAP